MNSSVAIPDAGRLADGRSRAVTPGTTVPFAFHVARQNMRQLVLLNWIAITGQLAAIGASVVLLGVNLPLLPMLGMIALQVVVNLLFVGRLARSGAHPNFMLALGFDVVALTVQLYLSGGTDNPFCFLYLLHVVLAAILLTPARAALIAAGSVLFFCALSFRHVPLVLSAWDARDAEMIMTFGRWSSFGLVAILLTILTARINRNLRLRDEHLSELGQKRVEDLAIMRMGLFASGAAHELGTPLSSLAVLIADWRRSQHLADDEELAAEMDLALHELDRCKTIVSNILHSSGYARSEELKVLDAGSLLSDVIDKWEESRPGRVVERDFDAADGAFIAFQPALQQALSSILDNADEAGSDIIRLVASRSAGELRIAVVDSGPGFPEDLLETAGNLYESSKGPGHGIGLFLANHVARQLGGYLQIENRAEGGASVAIVLPIMREARAS
ncbi:ATP-binding protein [Sphingomonas jaspsi]|uniref:ATP-binding protein n=1 Tax=Sphingomonas jaspsi TaxID=392409 RepID=UPI0004AFAC47|nr:ATP-binding protein [Sphingomonas jaspsi]